MDHNKNEILHPIILASASPRRKELLEQIGLDIIIMPSQKEEVITSSIPSEIVLELSYQKAKDICDKISYDATIIGADTIVTYQDSILGKPKDETHAFSMLKMLQGRTHTVYTGVTIISKKDASKTVHSFVESTAVTCYPMTDAEIYQYISTGDPMDKAGSYGIQGIFAKHIQKIQGDYNNVVGLPLGRLYQEL
ncbi:Maf family protein [Lachnospiraceae bacterium LCP25S3_G4]